MNTDGLLQQVWDSKPRYCYNMLQLRSTPLHSRSAIHRKRTRTLPESGKRMLWSPKWRSNSQPSIWCNNSPHRLKLVPANNLQHKHKLLAPHTSDHWIADCCRCNLRAPKTIAFHSRHSQSSHLKQIRLLFHSENSILANSKKRIRPRT